MKREKSISTPGPVSVEEQLAALKAELEQKDRELQVEAALEKVRIRTMAMQKSTELTDTTLLLFRQFETLGQTASQVSICLFDETVTYGDMFFTLNGEKVDQAVRLDLDKDRYVMTYARAAFLAGKKNYSVTISGKNLQEYNRWRNELIGSKRWDESETATQGSWYVYGSMFSRGMLAISGGSPIPDTSIQLLERFTAVFDLVFTRFLDLQRAENQAREAQIEVSLERVRAKTMAMYHSSDLLVVIAELANQLQLLGFKVHSANFNTSYREKDWHLWLYTPGFPIYPQQIHIPYFDHPYFNRTIEALAAGSDFNAFTFTREEKDSFLDHLYTNTIARYATEERKKTTYAGKGFAWSVIYLKNTAVTIANYDAEPYTDEQNNILRRFGNTFEQSYTRFLDLQKAEAQAREAQIEAGLERVRARAMAMRNSDELNLLIGTLFQELTKLDLVLTRCTIMIFDPATNDSRWWMLNAEAPDEPNNYLVPNHELPPYRNIVDNWKARTSKWIYELSGKTKKQWDAFLFSKSGLKDLPLVVREGMKAPDKVLLTGAFNNFGSLNTASLEPLTDEQIDILLRFANVFDLTYTRFNDLKQAESQAREARIEASLERVRSRTMAMQRSEELAATVKLLFEEFKKFGTEPDETIVARGFITNVDETKKCFNLWITDINGDEIRQFFKIDFTEPTQGKQMYEAWKSRQPSLIVDMHGEKLNQWLHYLIGIGLKVDPSLFNTRRVNNFIYHSKGFIGITSSLPLTAESIQLLERFAKVFDLTYTRFTDLQQAEAQAREAVIETALERIRSKTMAMHSSSDVSETVIATFDELQKLGIEMHRCGVGIFHEPRAMEVWTARSEGAKKPDLVFGTLTMAGHPMLVEVFDAWKRGDSAFQYAFEGDDLAAYIKVINDDAGYPGNYDITNIPLRQYNYDFYFPEGNLFTFTLKPLSQESIHIFKRFAAVFGQTYRRYLDLRKAEAQAREAQIESSLERVRGRAMAMQQADDVLSICALLFTELQKQGFSDLRNTMINIHDDDKGSFLNYDYSESAGRSITHYFYNHHPVIEKLVRQTRSATDAFTEITFSGKELADWRVFRMESGEKDDTRLESTDQLYYYFYSIGTGAVGISTFQPLIGDQLDVLKRFRNVFELAYRRYIDITTAAAQAREAQIEAALERVRAKAMAMHNSQDLATAASMVFTELRKLGIAPIRGGVGVIKGDPPSALLYSATSTSTGDQLSLVGEMSLSVHPVLKMIYDAWKNGLDYFPELSGEELRTYYEKLSMGLSVPQPSKAELGKTQFGHFISVSIGCLYAWSETKYSEAEIKILGRFAGIVDLTFRRYMELQQSEANARDAVRDASLDRVRAQIASMRTTSDLDRIIPLIWHELTILNIPFVRCGVFIMDEQQRQVHTFLSTPDGKAIAAFQLPYENENMREALASWRRDQLYITHWDKRDFLGIANAVVEQGAAATPEQYLHSLPAEGIYLHFLPFLQGMLYVGNVSELREEDIQVLQSVADAFSTAYARYEDFTRLEAAKMQVDKALSELKQAQQQLVQAEKMASLGELTAGIAHEIQNPLNFVNNFSEVSVELLQEMKAELDKGDTMEAKSIAADVQQNLEKILHHGKRADGIVKGMLQHSRSGSGQKEPVDINKLTEEYVRLAYHGLRAKDKSFNAKFETSFDPAIGIIQVISQDMGRVILNLINNAFYAVNEKQKQKLPGYEAVVRVNTRRTGDCIEIEVADNGNGIPHAVINKIFQPFFTTKPTGQGTGLGLSLSYDIVTKGHGGDLKVETTEGAGTSFIIQLPNQA